MEFACKFFGYDKLLPMNTGAEAVETALKLARRWGYRVKGITPEHAKVVVCSENFHGRTITIISMSTDPSSYADFGPYTPGFIKVQYNNVAELEEALNDPDVVGFLLEPIQGEAGVVVPDEGICVSVMTSAGNITSSLSPMRSRRVSDAPVNCLPVIMRMSILTY